MIRYTFELDFTKALIKSDERCDYYSCLRNTGTSENTLEYMTFWQSLAVHLLCSTIKRVRRE